MANFKVLVREYFQERSKAQHAIVFEDVRATTKRLRELERKILSELERFTAQDVAELPFGSEEDILP